MERLADYVIVAAGPGDAGALGAIHVKAWRETYRGLLPSGYLATMDARLHARRWRHQLTSARRAEVVLAAEGREGLVGYCEGVAGGADGAAEVSTLYLLRSAQRAGLGRRLLTAVARVLQAREAISLRLWVLDGNTSARGFYDHLGGVACAQRAVRGWGGGLTETAYVWSDIRSLAVAG